MEKIKKSIFGEKDEIRNVTNELTGFPEWNEGIEISQEEFRKFIEDNLPEEVYVRGVRWDDYGSIGTFFIRRTGGTIIRVDSHYPTGDGHGNVRVTDTSPVSVLDNLPYREVASGPHPGGNTTLFQCKYILVH